MLISNFKSTYFFLSSCCYFLFLSFALLIILLSQCRFVVCCVILYLSLFFQWAYILLPPTQEQHINHNINTNLLSEFSPEKKVLLLVFFSPHFLFFSFCCWCLFLQTQRDLTCHMSLNHKRGTIKNLLDTRTDEVLNFTQYIYIYI